MNMTERAKSKRSINSTEYALLRWLDDEKISVEPISSAKGKEKMYAGYFGDFKWAGRYYEAEVLKIGNRQKLNEIMKDLIDMKITREEIISSNDSHVDSTTVDDVPVSISAAVKETPQMKRRKRKAIKNQEESGPVEDVTLSMEERPKSIKKQKSDDWSRVKSAKERAEQIFNSQAHTDQDTIAALQKEIKSLKEQMSHGQTVTYTNSNVNNSNSTIDKVVVGSPVMSISPGVVDAKDLSHAHSSPVNDKYFQVGSSRSYHEDYEPYYDEYNEPYYDEYNYNNPYPYMHGYEDSQQSCKMDQHNNMFQNQDLSTSKAKQTLTQQHVNNNQRSSAFKIEPSVQIELVPGHGIYISKKQLDAVHSCASTASKLIRNLMGVFFDPGTLATSSALGTRHNKPLDKDIVDTCIYYVQSKFKNVTRSHLIDHINDKCANYRRKR